MVVVKLAKTVDICELNALGAITYSISFQFWPIQKENLLHKKETEGDVWNTQLTIMVTISINSQISTTGPTAPGNAITTELALTGPGTQKLRNAG